MPDTCSLPDLATQWRARASDLRRWASAEGAACALDRAAEELEAALAQESDQLLSVAEAASLVARHRDTIGKAIRAGRLTNHGEKHRPRVRRGEVVTAFARSSIASQPKPTYDAAADARSILETQRGGR